MNATGGAPGAPTRIEFIDPPATAVLGQPVALRLRAVAIEDPAANRALQLAVTQGRVAAGGAPAPGPFTLTTDANGEAIFRFIADDAVPLRLEASAPGTTVVARHSIFVRLP